MPVSTSPVPPVARNGPPVGLIWTLPSAMATKLRLPLRNTVAEVRAATPDLTIVSDARYDVQPTKHRVRVTLTLTLTNRLRDTVTKRYYFDRAFLAVLPDTANFKFTWEGEGTPETDAFCEMAGAGGPSHMSRGPY